MSRGAALVQRYQLPWWGVQASANLQFLPGIPVAATYVATNAQVAPSLGRNLAACGDQSPCTATAANPYYGGAVITSGIQLIEPNRTFENRLNQVDIRLAKLFTLGRGRIQGMFDIYNLFNASTVLSQNTRFGPSWRLPANILGARLFKFGVQIDFRSGCVRASTRSTRMSVD